MTKTVIIQGSSRSDGDTNKVVNHIATKHNFDVIDLATKNIGHFDYEFKNQEDDFLELMTHVIKHYDTIIFATPVYWYTMSGIIKVFLDRISDLLKIHKDLGRKLRGKHMAVISCSNADDLKNGFNMPFYESANYLGMTYLGDLHTFVDNNTINQQVKQRIDNFVSTIKSHCLVS